VVRAKKSLGQHFLVDAHAQQRIVEALQAGPDDDVLEIGPGRGALTRHLAGKVRRLVAIELDRELAAALREQYGAVPNVEILEADALDLRPADLFETVDRLRVVGNIPYNITTPLIFHLLERPRPERIVVMVQREVADRILAAPGGKVYGALSVGVRAVAAVERVLTVRRGAFRPIPDVDSAVLRIVPVRPPLDEGEEADLRALTRTVFSQRRKQLQAVLRSAPAYGLGADDLARVARDTGIRLDLRPEALDPAAFITLARALRAAGFPRAGIGSNGVDADEIDR